MSKMLGLIVVVVLAVIGWLVSPEDGARALQRVDAGLPAAPLAMGAAALLDLKRKRKDIVKEMETLAAKDKLTDDEEKRFDAIASEDEALKGQIAAAERALKVDDARGELARDARREKVATARDDLSRVETVARPDPRSQIEVHDGATRDPNRGFKTPREFLMTVLSSTKSGRVDPRLRVLAAAGSDEQSGASDPYGGFLVPEGFLPQLLTRPMEADPTTGLVRQIPMSAPSVRIPARTDSTHSTSVTGGLTVSRREETAAGTSSRMQVEQIRLTAHSLFGLAFATEEILADSPISFAALIAQGFQEEFASRMLAEKLAGTGAGEFQGVIGHTGTIDQAAEGGQTADTINGTNIVKMRSRCWSYGRAIWLANHDTLPQLVAAHIALTNDSVPLFAPGNGTDKPDTLLGRPIFFSEYCKTLGDSGDLILGVWSEYLLGTLQNVESAESVHVRFVEHERAFKFVMRCDGQPWWRVPLTPKNSSTTLAPFVTLAAR
jgi:HK97 family phage major capsid protein